MKARHTTLKTKNVSHSNISKYGGPIIATLLERSLSNISRGAVNNYKARVERLPVGVSWTRKINQEFYPLTILTVSEISTAIYLSSIVSFTLSSFFIRHNQMKYRGNINTPKKRVHKGE